MRPTVSVLMSVYNGARFLREAVDSVLSQNFSDFEFIVIDDGSDDATVQALETYDDPRIVILRNTSNLGLPSSLNRGLSIARGKYVARQDADDVSYPERVKEQVGFLDRHPSVAVVGTDYLEVYEDRKLSNSIRMPVSDLGIKWHGLFQSPIAHASSMFRRQIVTAAGGYSIDSHALHAEDYDLWSRLIWARHECANLNKPLVRVRCDPAGVSRSNAELQYKNFRAIVQRNLERLVPGLYDDPTLAKLLWGLQVCGGFNEPLERVEKALKALEELASNFCEYFQLDIREQRRVRLMAQRRAAQTLLHNARQYDYAARDPEANELGRLALSLDNRVALSGGYMKLRVKNLLGQQSTRRLRNARKRLKSAIHPS